VFGLLIFFIKLVVALFLLTIAIHVIISIFSFFTSIGEMQASGDSLESFLKEANEKLRKKD
jgi:hypothetical protein